MSVHSLWNHAPSKVIKWTLRNRFWVYLHVFLHMLRLLLLCARLIQISNLDQPTEFHFKNILQDLQMSLCTVLKYIPCHHTLLLPEAWNTERYQMLRYSVIKPRRGHCSLRLCLKIYEYSLLISLHFLTWMCLQWWTTKLFSQPLSWAYTCCYNKPD